VARAFKLLDLFKEQDHACQVVNEVARPLQLLHLAKHPSRPEEQEQLKLAALAQVPSGNQAPQQADPRLRNQGRGPGQTPDFQARPTHSSRSPVPTVIRERDEWQETRQVGSN
jgi:hypothetical protein